MNRSRWIFVAVVVVAALLGAWWWRSRSAGAAPKYRMAEVDRGSIESVVSATGTIRPVVQVEVGSQVSGTVDKLYADYNSRVHAGQIICQLEPSSFRAREVQSEAAVARADASVKDGERALARAQELFNQKYLSQAELDAAVVALELRKADLKQARAQLEAAQVDLQHTTIRAPIDGVVISRSIDLGQTVAASLQAPKLFVIANNLSQMQVETRIDEADIGQMRPGLPVTFTVDAFPDREFEGQVTQVRLEPIDEQGVVTYTTVIHTVNPDGRLRPGMTANVTVKIERRDDVLRVPNAALRFRPAQGPGGRSGGMANAVSPGGGGAAGAAQASTPQGRTSAGPTGEGPPSGERGAWRQRTGTGGMGAMTDAQRAAWRERMRGLDPAARERLRDSMMTAMRAQGGGTTAGSVPGGMADPGGGAGGGRGADLVRRGAAGAASRGLSATPEPGSGGLESAPEVPSYRPGAVYVLKDDKPERVMVFTGITDGAFTEVQSDRLKPGDRLIVGMDSNARTANLQPPPGMGGPQFRGPGGGGRR